MHMKLWLGTIIALIFLSTLPAFSQATPFGQNKVQYRDFDWYFIQSSHFDVYFSQGGEYIADFAADIAESSYASISKSFRYQITNRIPIVVYNSHNDFQQTNVVSEYLEEGIGGVTELFKNRVVLPFEGDYGKFRHVIHHELVHAVLNDMFYGGSIQSIISNNITLQLPMWFNEGLAEYEALKWDVNSDMFLRDATIHEYLPPIQYLNGYMAYRGGQSVWNYIGTKYGEEKVGDILMRIRGTRNVDQGFRSAIGLSIDELSERWQKEQKVLYWPDIAKRQEPADYARKLTDHTKDGGFYNTSPSISPQGDKVAFISNRDDYFDVFIMNAFDGSTINKIINGQRTADFEELHLLTPGMSWSPDGSKLVLATKSGDQDAIFIIDVKSGDEQKITLNLDGIFSVDWSPTGNIIVFTGNYRQQSDIYAYNMDTKVLTNLTNDLFSDADPNWSPDGKFVYFSSDRGSYLKSDSCTADNFKMSNYPNRDHDIYKIDVATKAITRVTNLPTSDQTSPVSDPDGKHLYFISDLNGINNIYVYNIDSGTTRPLTNSLSGVYQLSISRDGNKMAFASLIKGGFDIFVMRTPLDHDLTVNTLEPTEFIRRTTAKPHPVQTGDENKSIQLSDDVVIKTAVQDTNVVYDEKMKADFRNYVFNDAFDEKFDKKKDTVQEITVRNNVDKEGKYLVNKYKLNFSPDIVYGNAGFNTYYGVQGSTIMAFSDMLGNHQIYILTNLLVDLKNSDYALAYLYLPKRIDYGIQAFHSARFIFLDDDTPNGSSEYRFRNYGLTLQASYPLTKFNRIEFSGSWLTITRENLDYINYPNQQRSVIVPQISYVHDNSLWGMISPANGDRYNFNIMASPKFNDNALGFYSVLGDYRNYYKFWKNYTLALRLAGGGSFGQDPQRFIIGGVDNWINRSFENNHIPLDRAEDFVFLTTGVPLRGYNYNARMGTKYAMTNIEFRFPFFGYVTAGPLPVFFQTLNGILFIDAGGAWNGTYDFRGVDRDVNGDLYLKDLLVGSGYGIRMVFLGFLVKMDVAYAYNLQGFSQPKYYLSLGSDF
ncbi:MAG: peptidase MA family metallohydrolase [Bacteroidota bacterium]